MVICLNTYAFWLLALGFGGFSLINLFLFILTKQKLNHKSDIQNQLRSEIDILQAQANSYIELISQKTTENQTLSAKNEKIIDDYLKASKNFGEIETKNKALEENLKNVNSTLTHEFKDIARNIFDSYTTNFSENSKLKIEEIAGPLKDRLAELQKKMHDCFDSEIREKFSLRESIKSMLVSNDKIRQEAGRLTNALKGNRLALGSWGEIVLNNILEASGLRLGIDYFPQTTFDSNEGSERLKPDVLIKLPENKYLIIDSKVSFLDFEKYENSSDKAESESIAKNFVSRLKSHIDSLAIKKYHTIGVDSPELTLMFIPIESWYSVALSHNPELHNYAWERNISLVSPPNLFIIVKTIAHIWKGKMQQQSAQEVALSAGRLYDQFVDFVEILQGIGKLLSRTQDGYEKAMSKLVTGRGNLISRTEKIRALGIKNTKTMDPSIVGKAKVEEETEELEEV